MTRTSFLGTVAALAPLLLGGPVPGGVIRAGAAPLGSAFTYQGRLEDAGGPVSGLCDLRFRLYGSAAGADPVGSAVSRPGVVVSDGYLTIGDLDFGASAFPGEARYLEIALRCPAGSGDYTTLAPRQPLTAAPYALHALRAGSTPWVGLTGVPAGFADGVDDTGVTSESDPTVLASVKDGVSWGELRAVPAGFADGVDDTGITSESDPQVGANTLNYLPKWSGSSLVTGSIFDNGRIGIGTASPLTTLHVAGPDAQLALDTTSALAALRIRQNGTDQWSLGWNSGSGYLYLYDWAAPGGTRLVVEDDTGNVGIGTSTPAVKLDVSGTVRAQQGSISAGVGAGIELTYTRSLNKGYLSVRDYDAGATGALHIGASYINWNPLTGYVSVPAAAFSPESEDHEYEKGASFIYGRRLGGNPPGCGFYRFFAPLEVHHGATITRADWSFTSDTSECPGNLTFQLYRYECLTRSAGSYMFSLETSGVSPNVRVIAAADAGIQSPLIDNERYCYTLLGTWYGDDTKRQLHGVRITYWHNSPH